MEVFESFQSNRLVDRLHALIQTVLVFCILAAINYIGMYRYERFDMTLGRSYTLSAESVAYLKKLERDVRIVVTIDDHGRDDAIAEILDDLDSLLIEYEETTRNNDEGRVRVEYLNVYQQTGRAKELGVEQPNIIALKSGERSKTVFINELYRSRDDLERAFAGENVITKSILEITAEDKPALYFTMGHGEMSIDSFSENSGLSELKNELSARNFNIAELDLTSVDKMPDDLAMLIIARPQTPFLDKEEEMIRTLLRRNSGRVMVLLEPGREHGLEDLFYEWGILAEDTVVAESDLNYQVDGGDLLIRKFARDHPITREPLNLKIVMVTDRSRTVREDPGRPIDDSLIVTELMAASDRSWGEKSYRVQRPAIYDEGIDLPPPAPIAAISERKVDSSLGISIPGGKLIVFGSAHFLSNNRIHTSGNKFITLNAIRFAIDREASLNIPPRSIRKVKLDLSSHQLFVAQYLTWLAPPVLIGLCGMLVYLARRQ